MLPAPNHPQPTQPPDMAPYDCPSVAHLWRRVCGRSEYSQHGEIFNPFAEDKKEDFRKPKNKGVRQANG